MFCKRCDGAYHCYCQQPPHKVGCWILIPVVYVAIETVCLMGFWTLQNVSNGPYLCPKHTKCHSCGSNVPGNGLSVRYQLLAKVKNLICLWSQMTCWRLNGSSFFCKWWSSFKDELFFNFWGFVVLFFYIAIVISAEYKDFHNWKCKKKKCLWWFERVLISFSISYDIKDIVSSVSFLLLCWRCLYNIL